MSLLTWSGSLAQDEQSQLRGYLEDSDLVALENNYRYYITTTSNGYTLLCGIDYTVEQDRLDEAANLTDLMSTITVGTQGSIIVVDTDEDDLILYAQNDDYIGVELGDLTDANVRDNAYTDEGAYLYLDGTNYLALWGEYADYGYGFLAIVPAAELELSCMFTTVVVLVVYSGIVILMLCYYAFLRKDRQLQHNYRKILGSLYVDHALLFRITNIVIVGIVVILGVTYYIETISPLSRRGTLNESKLASISGILDDSVGTVESLRDVYDTEDTELVQGIAYQLELDPDLSKEHLQSMASKAGLQSVTVLDGDGDVAGSSSNNSYFKLSTKETDKSYEFWDILKGFRNVIIQDPIVDDSDQVLQWVACRREDADGMVQIGLRPTLLKQRMDAQSVDSLLHDGLVEDDGFLFAVSADDAHTLLSWKDKKGLGNPASDFGLTDAIYEQSFSGFQTIEDTSYFVSGIKYNLDEYVYVAIPLTTVYITRPLVVVFVTVVCLILLAILSLRMVICRGGEDGMLEAAAAPEDTAPKAAMNDEDDDDEEEVIHREDESERKLFLPQTFKWNERSADSKVAFIAKAMFLLAYIALIVYLGMFNTVAMQDTIFSYIVNCRWEKDINIFSVTYIVGYMTTIIMGAWVIRLVLSYIMSRFGPRMETMSVLLGSFIKYAAIIGGGFHCLSAIGVNTSTLVTTAGVVTFVGGFGAKDMVGDVVAGIFTVFEGTFHVGDIVKIGDWRGTVVEIGIRTTKVASGGNVKVFNNSSISNVINMTRSVSSASVEIPIAYSESLERVEGILEKELPGIKERVPQILYGPYYGGVSSLGDVGVNIRIAAKVNEKDRNRVQGALYREIKLLFDRYQIAVPHGFSTVELPEVPAKAQTTKEQSEQAEPVEPVEEN